MKMDFTDQVVVVTGGSGGIGYATAELFGSLGAKVAICDINKEKLDHAIETLSSKGYPVYGQICDVSSRSDIFDFADQIEKFFDSPIKVWVSNAGIYVPRLLVETTEEEWERVINVNMKSVYLGGQIAYEKMREHGGVVINAASFAATMPSVGSGPYAPTKAAVANMTKVLAAELAPYNIRVCAYSPGDIATDMMTDIIKERGDELLDIIPLRYFAKPEEIASVIVFLASDHASYLSGLSVDITGGKFCVQNPSYSWNVKD